jgi:hypothetical protein
MQLAGVTGTRSAHRPSTPLAQPLTIEADGAIGAGYRPGDAAGSPSCGVRHLQATDGTPYRLRASATWQISRRGSGGTGGALPDGTFVDRQGITAQAIRSVNR